MGPSLIGDGEVRDIALVFVGLVLLQWGRRSSATESNITMWGYDGNDCMLQWGRRSSATESARRSHQVPRAQAASIGPSLIGDGESSSPPSTRPRPRSFNG